MINPLLIARKENAGILRKICAEMNATPRELTGDDWSLEIFLKSDLKNYLFQSHYVLDVSAFVEKENNFISLVEGITYQKDNANIVIYADSYYEGDDFLNELIKRGFTNIVANYRDVDEKANIEMMREDLKECLQKGGLPKQKWRRFDKSYDAFAEAREAAAAVEKEQARPCFSNAELHIAVVGAQSRIGATSYAMRLAKYFQSRGGESVVVCANQKYLPQLNMIKDVLDGEDSGEGIFTVNGVDICSASAEPQKTYNAEIYDFGNIPTSELDFTDFDKIYIVGGTSWNELPMIYSAQLSLNSVNYTVALNFSDNAAIDKYRELLSVNLNDVISIPFEPDPFSISKFEELFDSEFERWRDVPEQEETAEK